MAVGQRRDMQLINKQELDELRQAAQDGKDMRAALKKLQPKRYQMMEIIRTETPATQRDRIGHARGWIEFESDLGDALLTIQRTREGEVSF